VWQDGSAVNLDAEEVLLLQSDVRSLPGFEKGWLLLTNHRLLYRTTAAPASPAAAAAAATTTTTTTATATAATTLDCKSIVSFPMRNIVRIELDRYKVVVPPGVPVLRICLADKLEPLTLVSFSSDRSVWSAFARELSVAARIAKDL